MKYCIECAGERRSNIAYQQERSDPKMKLCSVVGTYE